MKTNGNAFPEAGVMLLEGVDELANVQLPDPTLYEYYRRLENREILINEDIDDSVIETAMHILRWNREDSGLAEEVRTPIKIYINSNGGDVEPTMTLVDTILMSKTPVITIGLCRVFSSAGYIFIAGHRRIALPCASCLIHDGSTSIVANTGKAADAFVYTQKLDERVRELITSRTNITAEMYDNNYRRDWFIPSREMLALGIADEIADDIDDIL